MLQVQARAEDQAVQLHEKLEAKRAATHAEKVRFLDSKFFFAFTNSKQATLLTLLLAHSFTQSVTQPTNQLLNESMFWVCVSTLCMGGLHTPPGVFLKVAPGELL